ncbi:MAG: hypothetical protein ACRD82_00300, partial [Blastocatellia bacterium]
MRDKFSYGESAISEYDNSSEDQSTDDKPKGKFRWNLYRTLLIAVPTMIPVAYVYLGGRDHWTIKDLVIVGSMFVGYWVMVLFVAARVMRHRHAQAITMASPLIELPLSEEIRERLASFADNRHQKLAVVAFELLDREIPRFEQEDERERAIRDNEHLRQQAGQGAFLVAVTTEILKRLLLISG